MAKKKEEPKKVLPSWITGVPDIPALPPGELLPGEYEHQLREQGGKCPICREEPVVGARLLVDIDKANKLRGLVCEGCRRGLVAFEYDTAKLQRAAAYIRRLMGCQGNHPPT